jgi:hypothetical protein
VPIFKKVVVQNIKLILGFAGILLLAIANAFHATVLKVELDRLIAEVGALLLVVGFLHFMFELRLREEMLREISLSVFGNERLYSYGLADCLLNSKDVKEPAHWEAAASLTLGLQYSPRFIDDFHPVLRKRAAANRPTTVLVMNPECAAAKYLKESNTGIADVKAGVDRIRQIVEETNEGLHAKIVIKTHDRVLRYSFIRTDESIWIKFYTNSSHRVTIPAIKVTVGTPLYEFFSGDIDRLIAST